MARHKHGRKRDVPTLEIDGEHEVDDMAIAAQFAALTYPVAPPPPAKPADENEIDLDGENESNEKKNGQGESSTIDSSSESEEDDSDSDEENENKADLAMKEEEEDDDSHIDMSAELAELERMEQKNSEDTGPPKTENELDPYHTPLSELEKKFQLDLTVKESKKYTPDKVKICEAGTVKNHMIQERTIIVESFLRDGSSAPLDEGSLLVFHITDGEEGQQNNKILVPMGKIFEVFGPVRKPLYTIRLPCPAEMKAREASAGNQNGRDENNTNQSKDEKGETKEENKKKEQSNEEVQEESEKESSPKQSLDESPLPSNQDDKKTDATGDTKPKGALETKDVQKLNNPSEDHWSKDGKYTQFLHKNTDLTVYYVQDEAKIIDAQAILRLSAKGCGKCNIVVSCKNINTSLDISSYMFILAQ